MIAIVFALKYEGAALQEPIRLCASVWNLGVTGKRCVNILESYLQCSKAQLIVSAGFAGGLQEGFPVGSLIIGNNLSCSRIVRALGEVPAFTIGEIITTDNVVGTSSEKRTLGNTSKAISVDCESRHIRDICDLYEVPMLAIRCISDTIDQDLPVPADILISDATGRPDSIRLLKYLLFHPTRVHGFCELVRNSRIAQKSLAVGLSTLIPRLLSMSPR